MSMKEVLERHRNRIMSLPNVTGVGVGLSQQDSKTHCILVYATGGEWPDGLERTIDGHPVEIVKAKPFHAM